MFDKFKYEGYFQLIIDGTGLSSHDYNLNNNYIIKNYKDGKKSYCKYVLECKLIIGNIVISLNSEFIKNDISLTNKEKQDYEIKAFIRMIKELRKIIPNKNS